MPKRKFPESFSHKEGYGFVNTQKVLDWEDEQNEKKKKLKLRRLRKRFIAKTRKNKKSKK